MDEPISMAGDIGFKKCSTKNRFARARKRDAHRIIHPSCEYRFHSSVVRPRPEDVGCSSNERSSALPLVFLLGESSFAPIDPPLWAQVRTMKIIRAARQGLAIVPFTAQIDNPIAIGIRELPNARRRRNIQR